MPITRAQIETILIRRCGKLLTAAGLDGTTVTGANPDLVDPIGFALRYIGLNPASPTVITDSDLSQVPIDDYDQLFDVAELRTLENVQGNLAIVNITVGSRSESFSDLSSRLNAAIERKRAQVLQDYGATALSIEAGNVALDIMQKLSTTDL